ncbi:MAG: methyltransferase domain-containing protein [Lentisphaerae bacterium]|nr:MAG: methyltransferase domain-containing protein [Lentisphaerota bacterium]
MLSETMYRNLIHTLAFITTQHYDYAIYGYGKIGKEVIEYIQRGHFRLPMVIFDDACRRRKDPSISVRIAKVTADAVRACDLVILATDTFQEAMRSSLIEVGCEEKNIVDLTAPLTYRNVRRITCSETAKVRESLLPFCVGDGVDLGYGGDPICESAICIDQHRKYADLGDFPQHLHGDASNLYWFRDKSVDYVFSSHLLEDFVNTAAVLDEWIRILKVGGNLVLFLPDEQEYRKYCKKINCPPNEHHIHEFFSLKYVKNILLQRGDMKIIHEKYPSGIYSFELVAKRIR